MDTLVCWHISGTHNLDNIQEEAMPTSPYSHLNYFVEILNAVRPQSILDIGLGNGKLGFIARDLLDVMLGQRHHRRDWQIRLEGTEAYGDYIQDHQRAIYDNIHIGDAYEVIDRLDIFDVVVLGDVLEHFPKEKGWLLLDKCMAHARIGIILFLPLGDGWKQSAIYGNSYEEHRSTWYAEEFPAMSCDYRLLNYPAAGPYGAFLIKKEEYIRQRVEGLKQTSFFNPAGGCSALRHRYGLTREAIAAIDLTHLACHAADDEYRSYFLNIEFKEHYQLLAFLSQLFSDATLFDIGTLKGYSALAMSYNPDNRVVSCDIEDLKCLHDSRKLTTIEYRIGNALEDPRLLHASLILLDTYHDGIFEKQVYDHLKAGNYRGLLILDDIHLNEPMRRFWQHIDLPKEDLTDLGHWSGTGLVDFSKMISSYALPGTER
jgi:hypothetical protein